MAKILQNKLIIYSSIVLLLGITFHVFVIDAASRPLIDFAVYLEAAKRLIAGENIYQHTYYVPDRWGRQIDSFYFYPPFLAYILSLLVRLTEGTWIGSDRGIGFLWSLLSYLCLISSTVCFAKLMERSWWQRYSFAQRLVITLFFTICFEPIYWGITDGQVTNLILLCLSVFFLAIASGRSSVAGAALAVATIIKISPCFLLLGLFKFRDRKAILSFAITFAALNLVVLLGLRSTAVYADFFESFKELTHDSSRREFLFNYVFDKALLAPLGLAGSTLASAVVRGAVLVAALATVMRWPSNGGEQRLQLFAFLLPFMIACSPILWFHYLAWALPAILILSFRSGDGEAKRKHLTLCVGIYFALSQVTFAQFWALKQFPSVLSLTTLAPSLILFVLAYSIWRCPPDTLAVPQEHRGPA